MFLVNLMMDKSWMPGIWKWKNSSSKRYFFLFIFKEHLKLQDYFDKILKIFFKNLVKTNETCNSADFKSGSF